jgi:tyrosyl-DNA phosphodiesterase 2
MVSKSMLPALLKRQLFYAPEPEPLYTFRSPSWQPIQPTHPDPTPSPLLTNLRLISWNIDFRAAYPRERMSSALSHLEKVVATIPPTSATVIFLQEMMESEGDDAQDAEDLTLLTNAPWIRDKFHITGIDISRWNAAYGNVTLVDRRLDVASASRLRFVSEYGRDALWIDIPLLSASMSDEAGGKVLRLCNIHLDSSYGSMRPIQWKALAHHMQDIDAGVAASIIAGDCNANQPRDAHEPVSNGFKDAYLELGSAEDDESGATWGFQSLDWKRWGRKRLDKQVFWGDVEVSGWRRWVLVWRWWMRRRDGDWLRWMSWLLLLIILG